MALQVLQNLKPYQVFRAFGVWPSVGYQLEARGILPKRARGEVTREWLDALAAYHLRHHKDLPPEAAELVKENHTTGASRERTGKKE